MNIIAHLNRLDDRNREWQEALNVFKSNPTLANMKALLQAARLLNCATSALDTKASNLIPR